MKKYIMIILAAISTLSLSFTAEAYTREELENQMRNDMSAAYSTYKGSSSSSSIIVSADVSGSSGTSGGTSSSTSTGGSSSGTSSGGGFSGGSGSGLFSNLINSGAEIFEGMKSIIFAVSGLGIVGVAIGGFFGNLNWKWLSAIIIGLMVIAGAGGILQYIAGDSAVSSINIQDSLKNAG